MKATSPARKHDFMTFSIQVTPSPLLCQCNTCIPNIPPKGHATLGVHDRFPDSIVRSRLCNRNKDLKKCESAPWLALHGLGVREGSTDFLKGDVVTTTTPSCRTAGGLKAIRAWPTLESELYVRHSLMFAVVWICVVMAAYSATDMIPPVSDGYRVEQLQSADFCSTSGGTSKSNG